MNSSSVSPASDGNLPFQLLRGLGFLVILLMVVSSAYAVFIIIQNWNVISV